MQETQRLKHIPGGSFGTWFGGSFRIWFGGRFRTLFGGSFRTWFCASFRTLFGCSVRTWFGPSFQTWFNGSFRTLFGGGFRTLSMENEGWDVARALAAKGVAAFVLKYRLNPTPPEMPAFEQSMREMFSGVARTAPRMDPQQAIAGIGLQIADARAAFALVRKRAAEWHVNPDRVGMVGFSAGAMLTLGTTLAGQDAKPAFIGLIYGPLSPVTVPVDAPPAFVALAADDPFFANGGFGLIESWKAAKRPVEFHLYEQGGHGFGMYPKETTSTGWFEAYASWLRMHGMLKPAH